jgi:aspartokinase
MKKNPLNDLDQFLQQEASSIVAPSSLSDKLKQVTLSEVSAAPAISTEEQLLSIAQQNPTQFYDALISVGEKMEASKNTMLINTALYLKHGNNWKEAVKEYWSK